jgi:hypothetical protein
MSDESAMATTKRTLDVLRARLIAVVALELPEAPPGPWRYGMSAPYWYHPREWCEGYVASARDFLREIDRLAPHFRSAGRSNAPELFYQRPAPELAWFPWPAIAAAVLADQDPEDPYVW